MCKLEDRRKKRMDYVDSLPTEVRKLVNEYGLATVKSLLDIGVTKPCRIRHVVETVLDEFSPTRGSYSKQRNVGTYDGA